MSVYDEIINERYRQDEQWGGPEHDDAHSVEQWLSYIEHQVARARSSPGCGLGVGVRDRFVKIAALAVAAVEAMDRERDGDAEDVTPLCTMCGVPGCEGGCPPSYAP